VHWHAATIHLQLSKITFTVKYISMAEYFKVRRKDREVNEEAFYKEMLAGSASCAIGLADSKGNPYVNSNYFLYDATADVIYFHTAGNGYTRSIIEQNNNICISISKTGRLYPAKKAIDFGTEYYSVTVFGTVEIVEDEKDIITFFTNFLQKYFPHIKQTEYQAPTIQEARRAAVYKVTITNRTAKMHVVEKDYPGAVYYNEVMPGEYV
jgi:nitroimidazol reductase NimA-like FMN-containing flavoprotein (pyridoxamine 5'-phosphate oxidase superfamily)